MKNFLLTISLVLASSLAIAASKPASLTEEEKYFSTLNKIEQTEIIKVLYRKMRERDLYKQEEKDRFIEAFAQISNLTVTNIANNKAVVLEAPGFTQSISFTNEYKKDVLTIKPSISYLMDFSKNTVDSETKYDESMKNKVVFIYFDPIRNLVIVKNPNTRTAVMSAKDLTMDKVKEQILTINPNFSFISSYVPPSSDFGFFKN